LSYTEYYITYNEYKNNLYYISYTKICIAYNMYKNNKKTTILLVVRRGFLLLQVQPRAALKVGGHDLHGFLNSFPGSGLLFWYGALQDWSQGDGGVMAPEAGEDVVDHHPSKLPSLGLQARDKGGLQAL
jgi:hypothetical protein